MRYVPSEHQYISKQNDVLRDEQKRAEDSGVYSGSHLDAFGGNVGFGRIQLVK